MGSYWDDDGIGFVSAGPNSRLGTKLCSRCGLEDAEYDELCFTCEMVEGSDILEDIGEFLGTYDD